jgi:enoyl-CoA hydratase/carnithine racemase
MLTRRFEMITCQTQDNIATVTLNRPTVLNALNRQTLIELEDAFAELAKDTNVKGVIITGSGEKAFAAGADIKELAALTPLDAEANARQGHRLMDAIETLGKPVIAAVNGYALGGGCELAMACTIRIASDTAKFGQPEVTLGLIPGYGGTQRLPRLIGKGRALQMILSAKPIDAQEAYRVGLVNEVVPAADLIARANAILAAMLSHAPIAMRLAIDAINRGLDETQPNGCALEAEAFGLCAATADRTEGTTAFLTKRKPVFHGA